MMFNACIKKNILRRKGYDYRSLSLTTERRKRHLLSKKSLLADRVLDYFDARMLWTITGPDVPSSPIKVPWAN